MPDQNGSARLDRIERSLELLIADHVQFQEEHKQLLTAQIVLTDRLDRFIQASGEAQKRTDEKMAELAVAGKHTDERLNALITIVDGIIHRPPAQP